VLADLRLLRRERVALRQANLYETLLCLLRITMTWHRSTAPDR
jgi:hypothetical protein